MSQIPKRLSPDDINTLKQLQWRYVPKLGRNVLFFAIFLGLFVLSYENIISYEQGVTFTTFLLRGAIPVPVLAMEPKQGETGLVAIIAPGFSGSKEHMTRLGIELTKAGIASYMFDFPDYGESPISLSNETFSQHVRLENVTALEEVVNYVLNHRRTAKRLSILLIGYSTGSVAVSDYLGTHYTEHDVMLSILLSPTDQRVFTAKVPANLLIITGAYDPFSYVANRIFQQGCHQGVTRKGPIIDCGNAKNGARMREVVLPFLDDSMLPIAQSTSQTILAWVHNFYPQMIETSTNWLDPYLCWLLLGVSGAYLALFPLCSLLISIFAIHSIPRAFWGRNALFLGLSLLVSIIISLIITLALAPFRFIPLFIAGNFLGYFFCVTIITILLMLLTRRFLPLPLFRQTIHQLLVAILLVLFLYFTLGQLVLLSWSSLPITEARLLSCVVLFVLIWPMCLLYEAITRSWHENKIPHGMIYAWLLSYGFKGSILVSFTIILSLTPSVELLSFLWPVGLILFLFLESCCSQLYKNGRAAIAGATVSAIVIAYALLLFFPFTS